MDARPTISNHYVKIVFLGSMQRDVKRSVETANLEYYATLQLGVVQMAVWIIGCLRIVQHRLAVL